MIATWDVFSDVKIHVVKIFAGGFLSVVFLTAWLSGVSTYMFDDVCLFIEIKVGGFKGEFISK